MGTQWPDNNRLKSRRIGPSAKRSEGFGGGDRGEGSGEVNEMHENRSTHGCAIVADGRDRAIDAALDLERIHAKIRQKFAEDLERSGFFRRLLLRWKISRELRTELERIGPKRALYSHAGDRSK